MKRVNARSRESAQTEMDRLDDVVRKMDTRGFREGSDTAIVNLKTWMNAQPIKTVVAVLKIIISFAIYASERCELWNSDSEKTRLDCLRSFRKALVVWRASHPFCPSRSEVLSSSSTQSVSRRSCYNSGARVGYPSMMYSIFLI